jgi:endothelin-converting enzyme/putative endopeptidase
MNLASALRSIVATSCILCWASASRADEARPIESLPYTPALDVAAMDRNVDPCVDFYEYSCGGWKRRNPIPPDQPHWDVYSKLATENLQYLWGLLAKAAEPRADRKPVERQVGDYFAACMDVEAIERRGTTPLAAELAAVADLDSRDGLGVLLGRLHDAGANGTLLFGFSSLQDFDDASRVIGAVFPGGLGLPDRDYYLKRDRHMREARRRYEQHIERMLVLLGEAPRAARRQARGIVALETRLARATLDNVAQRDARNLHHPTDAATLAAGSPHFDWPGYFAARGVAGTGRLNVTEPAFVQELDRVLAATPLADLKTWLRFRLLADRAGLLPQAFRGEDFAFNRRYLLGVRTQPPRWKTCVRRVDADLGEALGQVFVAATFPPRTREQAVAMVEGIQRAMAERLRVLPWMSEATKAQALAKLAGMRNKVGFPERWRDYSAVVVDRGDHFGNVVRATQFEERRQLAKIGLPPARDEWAMTPPTVNAYYDPQLNDMNFPAGVLQPPLFDPRIDAAPSWGNTGSTVGHELTHGFDDSGRRFDARGDLRDWWTTADGAAFETRAQCLVDQYAQYVIVDDLRINSRLTLGEDIADLGGTILAFMGWKAAMAGQPLELRDGLTPEQRFFVGMAQWACGDRTAEAARMSATTDVHSPLRYRVNGVVVNIPEFATAFACRAGQPMVRKPDEVCHVW